MIAGAPKIRQPGEDDDEDNGLLRTTARHPPGKVVNTRTLDNLSQHD